MTRSVPVPLLAFALFAIGCVLVAALIAARQINTGSTARCNAQRACVDAIDTPYVMRRPS